MARRKKSIFVCGSCGHQALRWLGRCPDCDEWNTFVEEFPASRPERKRGSGTTTPSAIPNIVHEGEPRLKTGIGEFDRALGGGVVPGSLVLIGGDPGIGKSTLVLQVLNRFALQGMDALYVSGEESLQQIRLRADRLSTLSKHLYVMAETCLEEVMGAVERMKPRVLVLDSIQTVFTEALSSAPGSVAQVRETASRLMVLAKTIGLPVFLVGHVTKDGAIAGPRVLEHLVDTVLYFEGDRGQLFRILRAVKNRFGSTNEIGVFEMKATGLEEVGNPSRIFLEERPQRVSGSVVIPCLEGTRPLLVEIQALVTASPLGMPRRTAVGVDRNRISLLVAVLAKRMGMELGDQDIFVNVAGGLRVEEPAADLGILSAMMSSFLDRPVPREVVLFGEVGLAGEIRGVGQPELRLQEAQKLGFSRCILSSSNLEGTRVPEGMKAAGITSIQSLFESLFK